VQHPVNAAHEMRVASAMHNDVAWSTMNNPTGSDNQPFSPRSPTPLKTYQTLGAGIPCYHENDAGPAYKNDSDSERQAAVYEDYKLATIMQLLPPPPLYTTRHLHPSISANQQQLQPLQASIYLKTENTASEQSDAQG